MSINAALYRKNKRWGNPEGVYERKVSKLCCYACNKAASLLLVESTFCKNFYLKVPRNPTNFAFICTQVGLILDIFLFFVCKKHYFEK